MINDFKEIEISNQPKHWFGEFVGKRKYYS
jgi:hypothetical protein